MKRDEWTHEFPAGVVLEYVEKQVAYHTDRLEWWEQEQMTAKDEMEKSLELREQPITGGVRHDAVFDQGKKQRYDECTNKAREHREERARYASFQRLLASKLSYQSGALVPLDVEDIRYFRMHGNETS